MKMKRILVLLASVALAGVAWSRPVTSQEAALAARAWASAGTVMGLRLPRQVASTVAHTVTNDLAFYEVRLQGGGTLLMAADTEFDPIIGFSAGSLDLSEGSPAKRLLDGDVWLRAQLAGRKVPTQTRKLKLSTSSAAASPAAPSESETLWAALLKRADKPAMTLTTSSAEPVADVDDVCVAPLLKTKWSQQTNNDRKSGYPCYNYYTPDGYPCGCTATALAQIMRYFEFPKAEITKRAFACSVDEVTTVLWTIGGAFAWDKMIDEPAKATHDMPEAFEAIGHLTYDAGVAIGMAYGKNGSGAYLSPIPRALTDYFGYASALCFYDDLEGDKIGIIRYPLNEKDAVEKIIYANIDAKRPVEFSIYGYWRGHEKDPNYYSGHSIVGDGYGHKTVDDVKTTFVHLNLGWSGDEDMWYNLPYIPTSTGVPSDPFCDYDGLQSAIFNIVPEGDDAGKEILSGRTVDGDGRAMPGVSVRVTGEGLDLTTTSDENGIYSFALEGGKTYTISGVSPDGQYMAELDPIALSKTVANEKGVVTAAAYVGNSWGNDLVMEPPSVLIGAQKFVSLNRALQAARPGDTVEIVGPTTLRRSVAVVADCLVVATNETASASAVTRAPGAALTIAGGATLALSNVVFAASDETLVAVENGGILKLDDQVDLGIDYDHTAVSTAATDGFDLAGALTGPTVLHCDAATREGDVFCTYSCDMATAMASANWLICADDPDHTLRGGVLSNRTMHWKRITDYPVDESAGYFVDAAGKTNAYYRMEKAQAAFWEGYRAGTASEFVVRRDGAFGLSFSGDDKIDSPLAIRGEGEAKPVLTAAVTAHFEIADGGSLVISNVAFVGSAPVNETSEMSFVRVNGGELTLDDGAEICGFTGRVDGKSGVVDLLDGTATVKPGALIRDCMAQGLSTGRGQGGAIYVGCNPACTLNLAGGTITNCCAATYGGGVYVCNAKGRVPAVSLSGDLRIEGNRSANFEQDDVYLYSNAEPAKFAVTGDVDGCVGIRYAGSLPGNALGDAFIANAIGGAVSETTLYSFFSDATPGTVAAEGQGAKAGSLVWAEDPRDPRQCEEGEAAAKLIAGSSVTFWREVSDALNEARGGDVVEVFAHGAEYVPLSESVTLAAGGITLRAGAGEGAFELARGRDVTVTVPSGCALTVADLALTGYDVTEETWPMSVGPFFCVNGGRMTLSGVSVQDVYGDGQRDANAVTVCNGGELTVSDSLIAYACNYSIDPTVVKTTEDGAGGAILVDHATARLVDTTIEGCQAWKGGGVCACNGSTVRLSGETSVYGNTTPDYWLYVYDSDIEVSEDSSLLLDGELKDFVGVMPLYNSVTCPGDTNRVATVAYGWGFTSLTNSAAHFERDGDGDIGVAVTNGTSALIVWSTAVRDGRYVDPRDGKTYALAGEMPAPPPVPQYEVITNTPLPFAFMAISRDEAACTVRLDPLVQNAAYTLFRTNSLVGGFSVESAEPYTNFTAEADGPLELDLPPDPAPVFWRGLGRETYTTNYFNN